VKKRRIPKALGEGQNEKSGLNSSDSFGGRQRLRRKKVKIDVHFLITVLLVDLFSFIASPASADMLIGYRWNGAREEIISINPVTGSTSIIATLDLHYVTSGAFAVDSDNHKAYLYGNNDVNSGKSFWKIYTTDLTTGGVSSVPFLKTGTGGFGFDSYKKDTLIGYRWNGAREEIISINPVTGSTSIIATLDLDVVTSGAFTVDSNNHKAYLWGRKDGESFGRIYTTNLTKGGVGSVPFLESGTGGFGFDSYNIPSVASFTYSPAKPMVGGNITFDASASNDSDGTIVSYEWDFGDGSTASGQVVTHTYSEPGGYSVALTVTDNDGLTNSTSQTVTVQITAPVISFLDKADLSRQVVGAAADGASEVVIQITDLPEDVTLDDIQISIPGGSIDGSLENDKKISSGVFTQTYVVPEDFVRNGHSEDLDVSKRKADLEITVNDAEIAHNPFYLFKPPVVLIHGIWSSHSMWNQMVNDLDASGYVARPIDYCNSCHFKDNISTIDSRIKIVLDSVKDHGYEGPVVIKKADVVAHSMGGILTCLYTLSGSYRSNINRIISIGTPFSGSQFANYSLDLLFKKMPLKDALDWIAILELSGHSVTKGAAEDLQVGSLAINQFISKLRVSNFPVPVYAITGDGGERPGFFLDLIYWCLGSWDFKYNYGQYYGINNVEKTMFGTNNTDFVVSFDSQKGESSKYVQMNVTDHMSEGDNADVIKEVKHLLNSQISSFNNEGFKPVFLICSVVPVESISESERFKFESRPLLQKKMLQKGSGASISFVSPPNGSLHEPGENIHVEVTCPAAKSVLFITPFGWCEDEIPPYEYNFTIDENFAGQFKVIAVALDETAGLLNHDFIQLSVIPSQALSTIEIGPVNSISLYVGDNFTVYANGVYQDGNVYDVTSLTTTRYSSSDANIVEVSSDGIITAKAQGQSVVTVENSDVTADINVEVSPRRTETIAIQKCTVTASSKDNSDAISISGTMDATADDFNDANVVVVTVDSNDMVSPLVKTFPRNATTFKNGKFKCSTTEGTSKASFALDTKTTKFSFTAKNVDLSGLGCPVTLQIKIGDSIGAAQVGEAIVNGTKPIPIKLLMGVKNSLRVDKPKFTKKSGVITQVAISGGFSDKNVNDANLLTNPLDITIGSQTFTVPTGKFKNTKGKFTCSKVDTSNGIAAGTFDFNKCTFTLTIKNTNFTADSGTTDFNMEFADFSESVPVVLP
jgi:PKD repeat protein